MAAPTGEVGGVRVKELESKIAQLEQAVVSHAVIDQAIGVVVTVGRMSPSEAWDVLREVSMCTNIKLRHVAELVVHWGRTGVCAADIRGELVRRIASPG
ncbi:ANTAR domain-containing protein [Streptomyces sp. TRM49041]|uniref:ANTAR domain-containing protein n=1 Tax=Streptomyces sp. TRM49041 TaxID=2603216 RepID=UPI0011EBE28D|nr:ANTAR domain-containing protein [Streptomyces sp. TRM49041]